MRRLSGFSLMEMMVVLLIAAIVAAASAPMVSKKMIASKEAGCPWIRTKGANIAYNLGNKNQSAIIGDISSSTKSRLHIRSDNEPHLSLATKNGVLKFLTSNDTSGLAITSNEDLKTLDNVAKNTIAIGSKAVTKGEGAVAIGGGSDANTEAGANSVAIGSSSNASEGNTVAIGSSAQTGAGSIAIGSGTIGTGANSVALGSGAEASATQAIAIGAGEAAVASGENSIAFGKNAKSCRTSNIAIGTEARAASLRDLGYTAMTLRMNDPKNSIAIGNESKAYSANSLAIGHKAGTYETTTDYFGNINYPEAYKSIAIGYNAGTRGPNSIAIGTDAIAGFGRAGNGEINAYKNINSTHYFTETSIAIGHRAKAGFANSIAIGNSAETNHVSQIVLGSASSTVYIPGNLVVDKIAVLGRAGSYPTYIRMRDEDDGQNYRFLQSISKSGAANNRELRDGYDYTNDKERNDVKSTFPTSISDRRLKNVGKAFVGGLEEIKNLEVFNYTFKKDPTKTPRVGIMAQDLQKIFPKAVTKGDDGFLRIRMEDMFYALVNAVKELASKFDTQDKKVAELEKQNKELLKTVADLEKRLAKLEKKN